MVQVDIQSWPFSGDYFESCNREVNCPCHFGSPASYDTCDMVLAWHINTGWYGDTPLDGFNFAMVARAPKRMPDGNWTVAIYIDERATEQQQEMLRLIVSGDAGGGGFVRRKDLTCRDCGSTFVFTVGEQEFFAEKGFTNEPTRCPACRSARRNQDGGDRERCIRWSAPSAVKTPKSLSGQPGTDPYTAVIVSVKCHGLAEGGKPRAPSSRLNRNVLLGLYRLFRFMTSTQKSEGCVAEI